MHRNARAHVLKTHNLGFFFGPGLPRSLGGTLGSMEGGARFRPETPPAPPLFLLPSTLGGASVLPSPSSLPAAGTGVALDSDVLSARLGGIDGDASGLSDDTVGFAAGLACGKRASKSGERRSVITLLFFADLDDALAVVEDIVVDDRR